MEIITREDIAELAAKRDGRLVSIYMPTSRVTYEPREDPLRLKELLSAAEEMLTAGGVRAPEARELLAPARSLVDDRLFWKAQGDGLALFLSSDFFRTYRLARSFDELLVVGDRFHLKPLLPLLAGDLRFYVLALSKNNTRLLQCTGHSSSELDIPGVPRDMAAALKYDVFDRQLQWRTKTTRAEGGDRKTGMRPATFHGQGFGREDEKEQYLEFFRELARGVERVLDGDTAPLIPAGVEYVVSLYREANHYPYISELEITGNPDRMRNEELRSGGWELLEPSFRREREGAADRLRAAGGTGHSTDDLGEIVPAAASGLVDTLFVAVDEHSWGKFDRASGTVSRHAKKRPGDDDLLDMTAISTFLTGGKVYAVNEEEMPVDAPVAAIMRY